MMRQTIGNRPTHSDGTHVSSRPRKGVSPRGGILLEVMLAMAIFVAAAAFILAATRNVFAGLERSARDQMAVDIAASVMAELEAGLVSIMDLRGTNLRSLGSIDSFVDEQGGGGPIEWALEVSTQRTQHRDMTLIELTVREDREGGDAASHTLRRIMRLRERDAEMYEADDLFDGL